MFCQDHSRKKNAVIKKVDPEKNPADLMTKSSIPVDRINRMIDLMGCTFEEGRPESAPTLRREGGVKTFALESEGGVPVPPRSRNAAALPPRSPAARRRAAQPPYIKARILLPNSAFLDAPLSRVATTPRMLPHPERLRSLRALPLPYNSALRRNL